MEQQSNKEDYNQVGSNLVKNDYYKSKADQQTHRQGL